MAKRRELVALAIGMVISMVVMQIAKLPNQRPRTIWLLSHAMVPGLFAAVVSRMPSKTGFFGILFAVNALVYALVIITGCRIQDAVSRVDPR